LNVVTYVVSVIGHVFDQRCRC